MIKKTPAKKVTKPKVVKVVKEKIEKTATDKYYAELAKECRYIWSRQSPIRKQVLKESRSLDWTTQMPKHNCAMCKKSFSYGDVQVDHMVAICKSGEVNDLTSLLNFLKALDVIPCLLQVLCKPCHSKKTKVDVKKI